MNDAESFRAGTAMGKAGYGKIYGHGYRLAYAKLGNNADAEDVTQNVMFKLLSHGQEIQTEEPLKRWLIRVTANESVNLFRSA